MIKYTAISEALPGSFALPMLLPADETLLTSLTLHDIGPGDRIELEYSLTWEKPAFRDIGDIELMLRRGSPDGQLISWNEESCYEQAVSTAMHTEISETSGELTYYLFAASAEQRAVVTGPLVLKGHVTKQPK